MKLKLIYFLLILFLLISCSKKQKISKADYEDLNIAYTQLKNDHAKLKNEYNNLKTSYNKLESTKENMYQLLTEKPDKNEFIFKQDVNYIIGLSTIKGYFIQKERKDWEDEMVMCDCFVVTGGSKPFIDSILGLIESGNNLNFKNENNQPVININLKTLNEEDKQTIMKSGIDNQISMLVFNGIPKGRGVSVNHSSIDIIKINESSKKNSSPH